ncbi:DUF4402 domain-containing protein [Parasphingopyxis marina]|uniref:DUF4402 domain-containing protein n=1 Tax=Parasphingopyxis marina TaxID=2761622 RepID=A0A842HV49_9SPHN|nr:DUF4402 domain-containing protein [Parasphingopyxis marina]MBC2776261.1 DUF4402 domain-containing protein [Parasphingopyxis marina]
MRALPLAILPFCLLPAAPASQAAAQGCRLCQEAAPIVDQARPRRPISIDITTAIDFDRMALIDSNGGAAEIDPVTGARRLDRLASVGGMYMRGEVLIRGDQGRAVRIDMPDEIVMHAPGGRRLELVDMRTDLPGQPRIGNNGELRFSFGGRILVDGDDIGRFHGRMRIHAEYE